MQKLSWRTEKRKISELAPADYNPRGLESTKVCRQCGEKYQDPTYNKSRKYCSQSCWHKNCARNLKSWLNPANISLRNKNLNFRKKVSEGLKKYFANNPRCNEKWYIQKYGINYIPKKPKHCAFWKSLSVRLRKKHSCQRCNSKDNLDVHHIIPFTISKSHSIQNVVVLCRRCHKLTEDNNLKVLNIVGDWDIVRILYRHRFNDVGRPIRYEQ